MRSMKEFIEGGYRHGVYRDGRRRYGGWRSGMHVTFDSQTEYENFKIQLHTEFPQINLYAMNGAKVEEGYGYTYDIDYDVVRYTRPGLLSEVELIIPGREFLPPQFDTDAVLNFVTERGCNDEV